MNHKNQKENENSIIIQLNILYFIIYKQINNTCNVINTMDLIFNYIIIYYKSNGLI